MSSDEADRDASEKGPTPGVFHDDADDRTVISDRNAFAVADPDDATVIIDRLVSAETDDPAIIRPSPGPDAVSGQVVVGDIPRQPPGFQPRAALLAELDRARPGIAVLYAATGGHGVGKTQLAAAYARAKLAEGWRIIAWIDAEDIASVPARLATVVDAPGVLDDGSGRDAADGQATLRQRLEAAGDRCLIVLDNVDDPDELRPYLPSYGAARVLIGSRRRSLTKLGANVPVGLFTVRESVAFLTARTGLADSAGAASVAAELGHLPLALAQAAAVISEQRLTYATYLERCRARPAEDYLSQEQPYPHGVVAAVLLSLDAVRASDQGGTCIAVMELLSVLSTSGVCLNLLHAAGQTGVLPGRRRRSRANAALVDRALAQLARRSLLTFSLDGQVVVAHRLIMSVVRDELTRRRRLTAVCRAAAYTLDVWAGGSEFPPDRAVARDVPSQIKALLENAARPAGETVDELAQLLLSVRFWALYYLNEQGDSAAQAVALGEPLVADFERVLGSDHPDTLGSRNNLAAAYQAAGRVDEAIPLFERTLAARERLLGTDHPDVLTSRNNLAAAYQAAGRVDEAIPLFERTLAARERLPGGDDLSIANSRSNLASAYREAGRAAAAIPLFEQALAARERLSGVNHPDTVTTRENLARARKEADRG